MLPVPSFSNLNDLQSWYMKISNGKICDCECDCESALAAAAGCSAVQSAQGKRWARIELYKSTIHVSECVGLQ